MIGETLNQIRKDKQIKTAPLCQALDISPATYARLVNGQTPMKLSQFFALLDHLRLAPSDITLAIPGMPLPIEVEADEVLELLIGAPSLSDLKTAETALRKKAQQTGNAGYTQLASLVRVEATALAGATAASTEQVVLLFHDLDQVPRFSTFDLRLLSELIAFLPFGDGKAILEKSQSAALNAETQLRERILNRLYLQFMQHILATGSVKEIKALPPLITRRMVMGTNIFFVLAKRFTTFIPVYFRDPAQAQGQFNALLAASRRLAPKAAINDELTKLWAGLAKR
ncbi:helix-turn-helix domain-containing protein [Lacticaseibacillus mingshuiensis]|uniref:helix-turn-helix domain-containing protein n=1 Tax=Lacticaseibacillus mingshuiensis TaxID=2799574 RepID=UPI001951FB07|nr:helix-turn-helix transcriptional regulator [Lacticaseibacillus mingshuiensis]